MSKIEVNAIEPQCGTNLTVGASGDTITFPSGTTVVNNGSQTGFGRTGTVDWQTGSIKTATFTAANGEGYFANTSGGAFTMNLPAGTAGNIVSVVDYTNTFQTNALTVAPNGAQKIGGIAASVALTTEGQSVTFVYVDDTEGWKNVQDSTSNVVGDTEFIVATVSGACNTLVTAPCCANVKIATFTGPGSLCVSQIGTGPFSANSEISYMVVAAGGGGGSTPSLRSGGGGAGGFREGKSPLTPYTSSPLNAPAGLTLTTVGSIPVTVGAGGPSTGSNSVFSTITSAGGGGGANGQGGGSCGANGGSGGGGGAPCGCGNFDTGGTGNTPVVSPPQGNDGGGGSHSAGSWAGGGGGGGAGAAGTNSDPYPAPIPSNPPANTQAGPGGAGVSSSISSSATAYAGGGGGGHTGGGGGGGTGGTGGGGAGGTAGNGTNGTANTGGGGGGGFPTRGTGGSGIVIIRYKFQ